jgi:hypothetical protein
MFVEELFVFPGTIDSKFNFGAVLEIPRNTSFSKENSEIAGD